MAGNCRCGQYLMKAPSEDLELCRLLTVYSSVPYCASFHDRFAMSTEEASFSHGKLDGNGLAKLRRDSVIRQA